MYVTKNDLLYGLEENEKTAGVYFSKEANGDIFIPQFIEHDSEIYIITSIKVKSFYSNLNIRSVTFSDKSQVYSIGNQAFAYSSLEKIIIPRHVKIIDQSAFYSCSCLTTIIFSKDSELDLIRSGTFSYSSIETIKIPSHVKRIESNAFYFCENLKNVNFFENSELYSIAKDAFFGSSIESIEIPSSVEILEEGWCNEIFNLNHVFISPDNQLFLNLDNKIVIGKGIKNIFEVYDQIVFARRDIKEVVVPSFIKYINSFAFFACEKLKTLKFPKKSELYLIGKYAFSCSSIERIRIPKCTKIIDEFAFSSCNNLKKIEFPNHSKLRKISNEAFSYSSLPSIIIPSHVKSIGNNAFIYCENLKSIEFLNDKVKIFLDFEGCLNIILLSYPNAHSIYIGISDLSSKMSLFTCPRIKIHVKI